MAVISIYWFNKFYFSIFCFTLVDYKYILSMGIFSTIFGFIFIALGLFVRIHPDAISGYSTMPREKRRNVDIDGLSRFMRKWLIIAGVSSIVGYWTFRFAGMNHIAEPVMVILPLCALMVAVVNSGRYDRNEKKYRWLGPVVMGTVFAFTIIVIIFTYSPTRLRIDDDSVRFTGKYGVEFCAGDIANVEITDNIPRLIARTNGASLGGSSKGFFTVEGWGRCRLFRHHSHKGPYIVLTDSKGKRVIFRTKSAEAAQSYVDRIAGLECD